jgi:hypothetical protein
MGFYELQQRGKTYSVFKVQLAWGGALRLFTLAIFIYYINNT